MTTTPAAWVTHRARFLFPRRDVRGADAPLASATKDGVSLRSDLDFSVWNPDSDVSNYKLVEPDDFVIGLRSFQHGISHSTVRGLVSPAYTVLRAAPEAEPRFYKYYFRSSLLISHLANITQGIRQGQAIDMEAFQDLEIPLPPLEEQRRIADFLDAETSHIDRLIRLRHRLVDLLTERDSALRDSLINRLFTTEGEVPLRRIALGIEQGESPQCEARPRELGEWGVLKLSAVKHGVFHPSENKRLPDGVSPTSGYEIQPGDLLVTRANTPNLVGDAAVVCEDSSQLLLPDLIYRVRLPDGMNAEFLMHVALSGRTRSLVEAVARGSSQSMVKLRGEDIRSWPVPRASRAQQAELVREMQRGTNGTQKLRQMVAQQITLLVERRQALITAAVTGQFDVTTASGRNVTEGAAV